jgi:O-antigen/teichoic acid export membrane protein
MNSVGRTIAKNASVMMGSQIVTWGLALVFTVLLPRYLGAAGVGKYQLAASLWTIMGIFIAFGMDTLLTKEISRDPGRLSDLFSTSVLLRTGIFLASFVVVAGYAQLAGYPQDTKEVIYIFGLSSLVGQLVSACRASLQGLERMEFISLGDIAQKVFLTAVAVIFMLRGYGLLLIALVEVAAALASLAVQYVALARVHQVRFRFNRQLASQMLQASFPYLLLTGFAVAYSQIDVVIISLLVSEQQIGWYSAALRLTGTFVFVPTVFMTALLPASSRMHQNAPEDLRKLVSKSFDLLLLACIPIGLGVMVIANPLVVFLYGADFAKGGTILALMGIVVIFFSINMLVGQFFISSDRQRVWVVVMAAAAIITVPLDLVLVPWCQSAFGNGAFGGALSYLVTEGGMVVFGLIMLPKGILSWKNGRFALRATIAGLAMAAVVWQLRNFYIVVPIGVGGVVYLAGILALRLIPPEDWSTIKSLGAKAAGRLRKDRQRAPTISQPVE